MFHSYKKAARKKWFDISARSIRDTPRIPCDPNSRLIVLTQLHHPDVTMYLVAAKSFARYVTPMKFIIVDDGLTVADQSLLRAHFENIEFIGTRQVDTGPCPKGGCWERFLTIAALNSANYLIQLDADTITTGDPVEVRDCINRNITFTMGTPGGEKVVSLEDIRDMSANWTQDHVQALSEQNIYKLPPGFGRLYVHGCAGFAGYAPGTLSNEKIHSISVAMEDILGKEKWSEWGSEQVTSNYLVANHPDAYILPIDTYPFWRKGKDISNARLIHFFGTHRFEAGQYISSANAIIKNLHK
jgi:hypothetical protein